MPLIVLNSVDSALVKAALDLRLIDAQMVSLNHYDLHRVDDHLIRYLEVDWKGNRELPRPEFIASLQARRGREGDVFIAPDVLGDCWQTVDRINRYIDEFIEISRIDCPTFLLTPQGETVEQWMGCLDYLIEHHWTSLSYNVIIGIPQVKALSEEAVLTIINDQLKPHGIPYHLLGWAPTLCSPRMRPAFQRSFSFDSMESTTWIQKRGKMFALTRKEKTWTEARFTENLALLDYRIRVLAYLDHLKRWVDPLDLEDVNASVTRGRWSTFLEK